MCGIFGYYDQNDVPIDKGILAQMSELLCHRGPNDSGLHQDGGVALGNTRLSVIDIAGGHQPFVSDDGNIVVVQNGEIFNHIELAAELAGTRHACRTHSDTEVILRLYEKSGIEFISRLNGMFAIAIYDRRERAMYMVRDRIGVKPLYFHYRDHRFIFASEIKALLPATGAPKLDQEGLDHYLTFNYVPPPFTMFEGIRHVAPGTWMRITPDAVTTRTWWQLSDLHQIEQSEETWIEQFNAILDDAVRIRLRSEVPFGAFLSGGVDSSSVVGLMARHLDEPVKTFSIGFEDPRYDETPFAEAASRRFGTSHIGQIVDPNMLDLWPMATYYCDQPHGDVSFLPTYKVSRLAAEHVTVVLTGDGGDELFAGYDKYKSFFTEAAFGLDQESFQRQYHRNISLFQDQTKRSLLRYEAPRRDSYDIVCDLFGEVRHWDRVNQALYIDMRLLLAGNNLVKPDRMGMAVSLEARTPFLDYRMMELAFSMPGHLKLKDGVTKYLYKKAVAPLIGEELAYRKKQMFTVPVGDWFRTNLQNYCREHVGSATYFRRNGIVTDLGDRLLEDHIAGKSNNTRELRALIAMEHWARKFLA